MKYNSGPVRALKNASVILKKEYRLISKNGVSSENENWLGDNYFLLRSSINTFLSVIRKKRDTDFSAAFEVCREYALSRTEASETSIRDAFSPLDAEIGVCAELCGMLAAAAAVNAAQNCRSENGELSAQIKFILSLRKTDFKKLLPEINTAERLFCSERSGVYPLMDEDTKNAYRRALIRYAKAGKMSENEAAGRILSESGAHGGRHIGFFLPLTEKTVPPRLFILCEMLVPVIVSAACAFFVRERAAYLPLPPAAEAAISFFLILIPVSAIFRPVFDRLSSKLYKPRFLPSMDPETKADIFPPALITVSSVLPSAKSSEDLYAHLNGLYSSNSVKGVKLCVLFDLKSAETPELPTDAADVEAAKKTVDRLNEKFGGGFLMLLRDRVFSPTEDEYTGFERKRGAVEELVKMIKTGTGGFSVVHGDTDISGMKYFLALDSDTGLPFEALRTLLAAAVHPLNRAIIKNGKVVSGYGCFSPRTETSTEAASESLFSMLFTGGGAGAYSPRVSERNMDVFGTGLFCGKGLIDVDAYYGVCSGAFGQGEVLSHDILEGSLLRTAFVGGCVLTEGFPSSPAAYFKRQDRWIRGDVQNLRYIFRPFSKRVPAKRADGVTKLRLLENFRRAAVPVSAALCLLLSVFAGPADGKLLFAAAVLSVTAPGLFSCVSVFFREGAASFAGFYYSRIIPTGLRTLLRAAAGFAMLPFEAAVNLNAMTRAFYRSLISRKKTLEWTTAAQSEKSGGTYLFSLAAPLFFVCLLAFGNIAHKISAAAILVCIPFSVFGGIKTSKKKPADMNGNEKTTLLQYTAAIWKYFDTYADESNNHLPPDNVQLVPVRRIAKRTSPTNIGLYLLCLLAAADMAFITAEELSRRLSLTLGTIDALPKYKGLLYNWYDTVTLRPLPPEFVSSVDCGNYLICLTVLKEGIKEYESLGFGFKEILKTVDRLIGDSQISFLYSEKRGLFSVGFDVPRGVFSDSYYDTYMSEARMTSYYAAAKRLAPVSHWASLDRSIVRHGLRTAVLSYSGTAFEYFMPALFMPVYKNSFQWEGLKACVSEQKRRTKGRSLPYGVSESGFYDFDADMNYGYKAHGLRALSLKRDPDDENVFSPYSAFLFLPFDTRDSMHDLARFASLGAYGENGFFEAVDFTKRAGREDYMIVRSYMAHHSAMSMIAAVNALSGNVFVKRFCADSEMSSALSLLRESVPAGVRTVRYSGAAAKRGPRRPARPEKAAYARPANAAVFSDSELTLLCDAYGRNRLIYSSEELVSFSSRSPGVFTAVKTGGKATPLAGFKKFTVRPTCCYLEESFEGLKIKTAMALIKNASALALPVKLENTSRERKKANIYWYFEPLFTQTGKPPEHPAFADMGIRAEYAQAEGALVFHRAGGTFMAAAMSGREQLLFECDRESILGYAPGRRFPFQYAEPFFSCDTQFVSPAAAVRTEISLEPGEKREKILLIVPGTSKTDVLTKLSALRRGRLPDIRRAVNETLLSLDGTAGALGQALILGAFFGCRVPDIRDSAYENTVPLSALWEKGISGDYPVIRVFADELPDGRIEDCIKLYQSLYRSGIRTDLILYTQQPADYESSSENRLRALMRSCGAYPDRTGGIHVINTNGCSPRFLSAAAAARGIRYPEKSGENTVPTAPDTDCPLAGAPLFSAGDSFVPGGYFIGRKTPRPWCHTLSNPVFGTLLSSDSLGYTWALNSRQNKLTPWSNDVCSGFNGESVLMLTENAVYDCLSGASVYFYADKAVYGSDCRAAKVKITVQVDRRAMKKRITVDYGRTRNEELSFVYRIKPYAADNDLNASTVKAACRNGTGVFCNPSNPDHKGFCAVYSDIPATALTDGEHITLKVKPDGDAGSFAFYMIFSATEKGIARTRGLPFEEAGTKLFSFGTGNRRLDEFASALLIHQAYDSRVLARTGFYQCSGAFGFRDQLQDTMNLRHFYPGRAKIQILRCAAAQFREGDVLHWFHPVPFPRPGLKGVRTRCSDDMLWLPLAAARYVKTSSDRDILTSEIYFLEGKELSDTEKERYGEYFRSGSKATLYTHCLKAVNRACDTGEHGLPLIKGGDWNDSFSEAGLKGKGESVWLAMFLKLVCDEFSEICNEINDRENRDRLKSISAETEKNILKHCFNGEYFIRGFYDDGTVLGGRDSGPCSIDLLVQAFASLAHVGSREQRIRALNYAFEALFDRKNGVVRLFAPPFGEKTVRAGYVNDYPAGVRENGGQYTHAAVWFAEALYKEGLEEKAGEVINAILPNNKSREQAEIYKNEPYALSADVRYGGRFTGTGGWSLYTGAAGTLADLVFRLNGNK